MGLHKDNGGNGGNILVVKRGAICLEEPDPQDEHAAEQLVAQGYVHVEGDVDGRAYSKYIKKFGSVDGMITDIQWYDTKEERSVRYQGLKVGIDDGNERFVLDLGYATKPYDAFTRFAEAIDYTQPVEFTAWTDRKKDSTGFAAKQNGQIVRQKYTKGYIESGESGCPAAEENSRTGKLNFDKQRDWLLDNILENIVPKIGQQKDTVSSVEHAEPKVKKTKAKAATEDSWDN
jgi:hypothetical protein